MPTKQVIVAYFSVESEALQAFATLRQNFGPSNIEAKVKEATLLKKKNQLISTFEHFDYSDHSTDDFAQQKPLSRIIDIVNGPIGQLLHTEKTPYKVKKYATENLFISLCQRLEENATAIVAIVEENHPKEIHRLFKAFDMVLVRHEAIHIYEELLYAEQLQRHFSQLIARSLSQFVPSHHQEQTKTKEHVS